MHLRIAPAIFLLLLFSSQSFADSSWRTHRLKAAMLYHFTVHTTWPEEAFSSADDSLNLCLYGEHGFGELVEKLNEESVSGRALKVYQITSIDQIVSCHMVYIAGGTKRKLKKITNLTRSKPILTVTDKDKAGIINFVKKKDTVGFTVSLAKAYAANLRIGHKLREIGEVR